jgi:hypothetical protein
MTDADRYFGYGPETWDAMIDAGYAYLCDLASRSADTDYTKLCQELHQRTGAVIEPHDYALAHVLGDIGRRSYDQHGVVVTVLVHYKGGTDPGPGFFSLCQQLKLLPLGTVGADTKLMFHAAHVHAVFDAYGRRRRRG